MTNSVLIKVNYADKGIWNPSESINWNTKCQYKLAEPSAGEGPQKCIHV